MFFGDYIHQIVWFVKAKKEILSEKNHQPPKNRNRFNPKRSVIFRPFCIS